MRLVESDGIFCLEIGVVVWSHPGCPELIWKQFRSWSKPPKSELLGKAQQKSLNTPRFFRRCVMCNERCNSGHMFDRSTCQGCAETHMGVVY
jgi:hypothetical protein